jgi:hypothetical protein
MVRKEICMPLLAGKEFGEVETMVKRGEIPEFSDVIILAIQSGSPAHRNQEEVEELEMSNRPSVVDDDLMAAYWSVLQTLGLLEC